MSKRSPAQEFVIPGLVFGAAIVVALIVLVFGDRFTGGAGNAAGEGNRLSPDMQAQFENEYDKLGVTTGPADAKLVVREFADYQCPACGAFAPTAERIREEYAETGKLRFVFFDFPLPVHPNARTAAVAARCAGRQDAFWGYHKALFANQNAWSGQADPTGSFLDLAVETGVDVGPFERCLEQGATATMVARNAQIAREVGVSATPTTIVGDRIMSGVKPWKDVQRAIEDQLAAAASDDAGDN